MSGICENSANIWWQVSQSYIASLAHRKASCLDGVGDGVRGRLGWADTSCIQSREIRVNSPCGRHARGRGPSRSRLEGRNMAHPFYTLLYIFLQRIPRVSTAIKVTGLPLERPKGA